MQYAPQVLVTFATKLYAQADRMVALWGFFGAVVGVGVGAVVGVQVSSRDGLAPGALIGALVLMLVMGSIGADRALKLRVEAQLALCQVQIEQNTRAAGQAGAGQPYPQQPSAPQMGYQVMGYPPR